MLCAINNIQSGGCAEDCKFCTQSVHNKTQIQKYPLKPTQQIVKEAHQAKANGAVGFCLVTSGKKMDQKTCAHVAKTAEVIKKQIPEFNLIACNGIATKQQLQHLKDSGVDSYNHNLETSQNFYPQICTTHSWQQRYETCENVKAVGLNLCSGGIFGLGETADDRLQLLHAIKKLDPKTVPINFFIPSAGLPINVAAMDADEALQIIQLAKKLLPKQKLMAAGGREHSFKSDQKQIFEAGIEAIVIGDYLTTKGTKAQADREMIQSYGYSIAKKCR